MSRIINYLSIFAIFVAGYATFAIKEAVHDLNYQLSEANRHITEESSSLNILKAEFAFLQSPKRLRILAEKHLELSSIKSDQMVQDPMNNEIDGIKIALGPKPKLFRQVRWNYKGHGNSGNIQTVAQKVNR
jgi:cell division protein FtsL